MSDNQPSGTSRSIDLAEIDRLVAALESDLARVKSGSASLEALRSEVDALRAALGSGAQELDSDRLTRVHGLLQRTTGEIEVDAFRAASYLSQIGRILGLQ